MTTATPNAALFDPGSHEPLTERRWDAGRAQAAIEAIVTDTEAAFDEESLWDPHPLDEEGDGEPLRQPTCLYLGAAGVIWALEALRSADVAELGRDWAEIALDLPARYRGAPDFPRDGVIPSLHFGEAGILLVAHALAPRPWLEEQLLEAVRGNAANPTLELMWGSSGTMLAAQVMHERTGDAVWAEAWSASADHLWAAWEGDVWCQSIRGTRRHVLGPAHGFVGNVFVLARGDMLDPERRTELERRAISAVAKHARMGSGLAQWPSQLEPTRREQPIRTQWCHGAPGIVASLASLAPGDSDLTALLLAGGELTWKAGPLRKGASLCHGTAGNGYAFLKLFVRTGDELWLDRARAFAVHAIEQVETATAVYGRGRHSLWSGDAGTALYLAGCLSADAAMPTLDVW